MILSRAAKTSSTIFWYGTTSTRVGLWLAISALLGGCAVFHDRGPAADKFLKSGSIGLSRPVPSTASLTHHEPLLGFMPTEHTQSLARIEVRRGSNSILLVNQVGVSRELPAAGVQSLDVGRYSVMLKQEAPLWYAPDSYFEQRGLEIPAEGSKERYRRGAFGAFALFLNNQTPLHSGPADCPDLQGIQLAEDVLKEIFDAVEIGSTVEVL